MAHNAAKGEQAGLRGFARASWTSSCPPALLVAHSATSVARKTAHPLRPAIGGGRYLRPALRAAQGAAGEAHHTPTLGPIQRQPWSIFLTERCRWHHEHETCASIKHAQTSRHGAALIISAKSGEYDLVHNSRLLCMGDPGPEPLRTGTVEPCCHEYCPQAQARNAALHLGAAMCDP